MGNPIYKILIAKNIIRFQFTCNYLETDVECPYLPSCQVLSGYGWQVLAVCQSSDILTLKKPSFLAEVLLSECFSNSFCLLCWTYKFGTIPALWGMNACCHVINESTKREQLSRLVLVVNSWIVGLWIILMLRFSTMYQSCPDWRCNAAVYGLIGSGCWDYSHSGKMWSIHSCVGLRTKHCETDWAIVSSVFVVKLIEMCKIGASLFISIFFFTFFCTVFLYWSLPLVVW